MFRRIFPSLLLLLVIPLYLLLYQAAWSQQREVRRAARAGYVIPSKYSRILALDYKGLLSDYLLLKTITFYGDRLMAEKPLDDEDWRFITQSLETVTDLDPYFLDPYLLGEGLLVWEAGKIDEANHLLEKGRQHRKNDWQIPFYIGFNYFYFQTNYEKGAEYLMAASRLPDSPEFLPSLAARLSYYGDQVKTAILFLKAVSSQTSDPRIKARLEKRLTAMERAAFLEEATAKFKIEQGRLPKDIGELVSRGYVDKLSQDPYGGAWVILQNGRVYSTSKFVAPPSEAVDIP